MTLVHRRHHDSTSELETQMILAHDPGFADDKSFNAVSETLDHAFGVLGGLINSLKKRT